MSAKLALKMALYRYSTRECLTYPTKVPSLSDKQVEKTNTKVKRAQEEDSIFWARQVQRIYARRKSTDWKVCRWTWTRKGSQTFLKAFCPGKFSFLYTAQPPYFYFNTSIERSNWAELWVTYMSRDNYVWHHCLQIQNRQIKICQMELETDLPN